MKAIKVLEKLEITRQTLTSYVKQNKIRVKQLENGFYDYNEDDVLLLEKNIKHKNKIVVYLENCKFEFNLNKDKINNVLKYIQSIV